ncbi:MFS transporter [Thermus sp. PS18]|uniref:MFS transporter n=1 Tax=Thermus sp. PS18 TaxID=2849039 RepID=UPI00226509C3|nr:MFS transporter [Thermus sp. PS18]UZX15531.1 MFS transporter [Thermus sp. PS18]
MKTLPFSLLAAEALRTLGEGLFALPLFAMAALQSPAPWQATLPFTMARLANLLALPLGAVVDRWERGRLLVVAVLLQALLALGLLLGMPFLLVLAAPFFLLSTLVGLGTAALLADMVRKEELERARGRVGAVHIAVDSLKDPLAGFLLTRSPWLPPFLAFAAFSLASLLYLGLPRGKLRAMRPSFNRGEVLSGLRFLWQAPSLRRVLIAEILYTFSFALVVSLIPFLILRVLEQTPFVYGVASLFLGGGSFSGSLLGGELTARMGRGRMLRTALLVGSAGCFFMAWPMHWGLVAVGAFLLGLGALAFFVVAGAIRLGEAPFELRGRVSGGFTFLSGILAPLGPILGGVLATVSLPLPFALMGILLLVLVPFVGKQMR